MLLRPQRSTRTDTLVPYPALFRSTLDCRAEVYTKLLSDTCPAFARPFVVPPNVTVEDEAAIDLGGRPLRLKAWPTAHTNTDLTVHDEKTGTLWAGDLLFERRLPTLDGSLLGWLTVRSEARRVGKECVSTCRSKWSPSH